MDDGETGRTGGEGARYRLTRERLRDGSHLAEVRARLGPGMTLLTDEQIEASLAQTLAALAPGTDVWVFGYGSLIWNPAFEFVEKRVAMVHGWHRRFCLWLHGGRGTPERPGLMLALDRGGSCRGVAFRVAAGQVAEEFLILWRREMLGGAYHARWLEALTETGSVRALAFVANRAHERFAPALSDDEVATHVASASGPSGSCAEYLHETVSHLDALGVRDASLERIRRRVEKLTRG
jgi:cation transport protein ChaC